MNPYFSRERDRERAQSTTRYHYCTSSSMSTASHDSLVKVRYLAPTSCPSSPNRPNGPLHGSESANIGATPLVQSRTS
eukprot:9071756-Alexandrium_andersonii.AAC.1